MGRRETYDRLGNVILVETDVPDIVHTLPVRTLKLDIWRRATDEEVDAFEAEFATLSRRRRRQFNDAHFIDHSAPEFPTIVAFFRGLFGAARTAVLLAPSAD